MTTPNVAAGLSRRRFIVSSGAALAMPYLITGCASYKPPSQKIVLGMVGCGTQGVGDIKEFLALKDCHVVAACDVDKKHVKGAVDTINKYYKNTDCKGYHDYRDLIARHDIDAVLIATPDNWHALVAVEAAKHKKDIYGEKPLAKTIAEQQAIVRAVQANNRIWQTGSWQRSVSIFHKAAEIVRNGLIGKVSRVEIGLPAGNHDSRKTGKERTANPIPSDMAVTSPPPELDYNTWLGPAHDMLYIPARIHKNWRWNYNTGGGQIMDWVGHHCDIAHWGLGFDQSGPMEVEGHGDFPPFYAVWNTAPTYRVELKYPEGITMIMDGGDKKIKPGIKWYGSDGWVYVDRGKFDASNEDWRDMKQLPENLRKIKLPISTNHYGNFIDSVKSRLPTITPVETAHHSAVPGHLGVISMFVGRKLKWDVATEQILNDPEASELMTRPYRGPWKLS